ncbi:hypothetical protein Tco_1434584, partial [Tanacetum coccineum]
VAILVSMYVGNLWIYDSKELLCRSTAAPQGGRTGRRTGRGGRRTRELRGRGDGQTSEPNDQGVEANEGVDGVPDFSTIIAQQLQNLLHTILAQVGNQGNNHGNNRNQNGNAVNDNIQGDVRNVINHAMVGAGHATYTDRFHELARLVPRLVTLKTKGLRAGTLTNEAISNRSLKRNPNRRGNGGEPSRDRNVKDDNKRTRTGNTCATTVNPDCRVVPRVVNPINARNPTAAHRACFECGGIDHFKAACPRLNQAHRPRGNHPN